MKRFSGEVDGAGCFFSFEKGAIVRLGNLRMVGSSMRHDVMAPMLGIGSPSPIDFEGRLSIIGGEGTVGQVSCDKLELFDSLPSFKDFSEIFFIALIEGFIIFCFSWLTNSPLYPRLGGFASNLTTMIF